MESLIRDILKLSINDNMIDKILSESLDKFQAAFTSRGFDSDENYEFFEQLGDLSINKFIVTYMSKRFPQLRSSNGVGVLASLRILYGSKETLSKLSEQLGLDKYVRCTSDERLDKNKFKNILEDVFEALFGAIEYSIDNIWFNGLGYIFTYNILEKIFNTLDICINYESLVDAKTRLNELKDEHKINIKYKDVKTKDGDFVSELYVNNILAGKGVSNVKKNAQIIASENGLKWIKKHLGIEKEIPERYRVLSKKIW